MRLAVKQTAASAAVCRALASVTREQAIQDAHR